MNNKIPKIIIIMIDLLGVFLILLGAALNGNNEESIEESKNVIYEIPKDYVGYDNDENGWYYVPKDDLSGETGFIGISEYTLYDVDLTDEERLDLLKETFEKENITINSEKIYENKKGNKVIEFSLDMNEYEEIIYYVFSKTDFVVIDAFNFENGKNAKEASKLIANTLDWK